MLGLQRRPRHRERHRSERADGNADHVEPRLDPGDRRMGIDLRHPRRSRVLLGCGDPRQQRRRRVVERARAGAAGRSRHGRRGLARQAHARLERSRRRDRMSARRHRSVVLGSEYVRRGRDRWRDVAGNADGGRVAERPRVDARVVGERSQLRPDDGRRAVVLGRRHTRRDQRRRRAWHRLAAVHRDGVRCTRTDRGTQGRHASRRRRDRRRVYVCASGWRDHLLG